MIIANSLSKTYGKGKGIVPALKNVDFSVNNGEFIAIMGKSGSGKSTLLNLLGGLDSADNGNILYDDKDITQLSDEDLSAFRLRNIGFVFQQYDLIPELTAEENILFPMRLAKQYKPEKVVEIAESLGIFDKLKYYPSQLSGGQQQRVAIARAIVNEPKTILADEPTGALDSKTASEIMEILRRLNAQGKAVIVVTHDMGIAEQCGRIIEISDGKIVSA